jgi:hypothetical protein
MFILNNMHDRKYGEFYKDIKKVIFDISEKQIENKINQDWNLITEGSVVCVLASSRKISTFYRVENKFKTSIVDQKRGNLNVIVGSVIAKLQNEREMTPLLNKYKVLHGKLPGNKLKIAVNVINLENLLGELNLKTASGFCTLSDLEPSVGA